MLDPLHPEFPDPGSALSEPDGLLAIGGNLNSSTLINAYSRGIFPWYEQGQPILWWSPSVRAALTPGHEYITRSMAKILAKGQFSVTTDTAFEQVIAACAGPRRGTSGTWITPAMEQAYCRLHRLSHAHSVECWQNEKLVGGLYGLQVGRIFCGESMFSRTSNASKVAFILLSQTLVRQGFVLIDCQVPNSHLQSLGVQALQRETFLSLLAIHKNTALSWPASNEFARTSAMLGSQQWSTQP